MSAKILLVEDDQYIRSMYSHILSKHPFAVEESDNGEDAYSKLTANEYDLVLLDIMIPKLDGLQILEKLKADGHIEMLKKVILLTNLDEESTIARGMSYGIRGYLVKSQNPPEKLTEQIAAFLS